VIRRGFCLISTSISGYCVKYCNAGHLCCFGVPGRPRVQALVSDYKELEFCALNTKQFEILSWTESKLSCHLGTRYRRFQKQIEGESSYCLPVKQSYTDSIYQVSNAQEKPLCIPPELIT